MKTMVNMSMLLALLVPGLGFSNGANAEAIHGAPPKCTTSAPGSGDAFVYTGSSYGGTCYVLHNDSYNDLWTSWDATTGFPNDQIQSVWVGPDRTLVLFWNDFDTSDNGVPLHFGPGQYSSNLGGWNKKTSAARLQTFPFGQCSGSFSLSGNSLPVRTLSLFTDQNFSSANDCTVLLFPGSGGYESPVELGFRNDTMTSYINNWGVKALFAGNNSLIGCIFGSCVPPQYEMAAGSSSANVGSFNDQLSWVDWSF